MSNRPYQLELWFITLLVLCGLVTIAPNTAVAKTPTLVVETVPAIEGIRFRLGDETFVTDNSGVVRITPKAPSASRLSVDEHSLIGDSQRVEFFAWSDGVVTADHAVDFREPSWVQVGFDIDYLVKERFRSSNGDILDSKNIDSFTIVDDASDSTTFHGSSSGLAGPTALSWQRFPPGTRWLRGVRTLREGGALKAETVSYSVRSVTVEGKRATVSSDPFVPSVDAEWTITVDASKNPIGQIAAVVLVAILFLIGGFIILMRVRGRSKTAGARSAAPFRRLVPERIARSQLPARVYVRVKLENGRTVEGWKMKVPGAKDSEALNLNVTHVFRPDGEEAAPGPLDSFVLSSQIVDLEIDGDQPQVTSPPWDAGTVRT
ncbi:MAG: hypothetical protein ACR2MC_04700 [Actinomycetota bacterium]